MEEIKWMAGSEKRFFDFIKGLNEKDKVALISHVDLDGIASARAANKVLSADMLKFVVYADIDDKLVESIKKNKINKVILTDIGITREEILRKIEKFADVLIIDHHEFERDFNSSKTTFMNTNKYCAAFLCYYLFSKVQDIEGLDWLVTCACIADNVYSNNLDWMSKVYEKYGEKLVTENGLVKAEGFFWDLQSKISCTLIYFRDNLTKAYDLIGGNIHDAGNLDKYISEVQKEIDKQVENFNKEKIEFKDGYFWEFNSKFALTSVVSTLISVKMPNKTLIIGRPEGNYLKISARRQDSKVNLPEMLKKLIEGFKDSDAGGHIPAAGAFILLKDKEEFIKRLKNM